jgi:hypothetical protein
LAIENLSFVIALTFLVSCLKSFGRMMGRQLESCALHEEKIGWNHIFDGVD